MSSPRASSSQILTSSDGCKIYSNAVGNNRKPSIVFVHGFTLCADVWDNIFLDPRYYTEFHLVRYDMRGHGRSGKPDSIEGYSSKLYADDFAAVVEAHGLSRPFVVGWSLGATVIADIAANLPKDTLSGVIYIAPCPYIGPIMQTIGSKFILDLLVTLTTSPDTSIVNNELGTFADSCFTDINKIPWSVRAFWRGMASFQKQHHMLFSVSRPQDPAKLFELGADGIPVLLLNGTADPQVMAHSIKSEIQRLFKNSEIHLIPGAGHTPHYENKELVMEYISSFVRRYTDKESVPSEASLVSTDRKQRKSSGLRLGFLRSIFKFIWI